MALYKMQSTFQDQYPAQKRVLEMTFVLLKRLAKEHIGVQDRLCDDLDLLLETNGSPVEQIDTLIEVHKY